MNNCEFVDYYELLQLSPNADTETIERAFRHLAKKFHPDNNEYANKDLFLRIVEAHDVLTDSERRPQYNTWYNEYWNKKRDILSLTSNSTALSDDKIVRDRLLSLLYVQRRKHMNKPGLGEHEMAQLLNTSPELVEFHLWYFRSKKWVERLENGHLAITAAGVDQAEQDRHRLKPERLLESSKRNSRRDSSDQEFGKVVNYS